MTRSTAAICRAGTAAGWLEFIAPSHEPGEVLPTPILQAWLSETFSR